MPKLGADEARVAEQAAEEGGPELIPTGTYLCKLLDVEVSDKEGDSGYHYWSWMLKIIEEGSKFAGREIRLITSLSPKAAFAIGGAFAAFGVAADTHTDELLGEKVYARIVVAKITKGSRMGEDGNNVNYLLPYDGDDSKSEIPDDF
jgi:hypothetical protein